MSEETEEKAKESDTCVLELLFHCLAPNRYCLTNKYLFVFSHLKKGNHHFQLDRLFSLVNTFVLVPWGNRVKIR